MENINIEVNQSKTDEVGSFIQKNQEFYKEKFRKMDETGKSISWNWPAIFFGVYWMIYRKMYFKAMAFFILGVVASYTPYIGGLLNFAVLVGIGIYANALYQDHVEGSIKKIKLVFPHEKEEVIKKVGGTNLPIALGLGVGLQLFAMAILVLLPSLFM